MFHKVHYSSSSSLNPHPSSIFQSKQTDEKFEDNHFFLKNCFIISLLSQGSNTEQRMINLIKEVFIFPRNDVKSVQSTL